MGNKNSTSLLFPAIRIPLPNKQKSVSIRVICVPFSYLTQTSQNAQIFIPKPTLFREFRAFRVPYISLTNN